MNSLFCLVVVCLLAVSAADSKFPPRHMLSVLDYSYSETTSLCACRARSGSCRNPQQSARGKLCGAAARADFSVSITVRGKSCGEETTEAAPLQALEGADVRIWQSNEDGGFRCTDECSAQLRTGGSGQVTFTNPSPGRVRDGWQAHHRSMEAEAVTRVIVSLADYETTTGFISYGNSTLDNESVPCADRQQYGLTPCPMLYDPGLGQSVVTCVQQSGSRDERSEDDLQHVNCTVNLICSTYASEQQKQTSRQVNKYVANVDLAQSPIRERKPVAGCPRAKRVADYYKTASSAIVVEMCAENDCHKECALSGLPEYARHLQHVHAIRLLSVLKQPDYCAGQAANCTARSLLELTSDTVVLLDAADLAWCCEPIKPGQQYFITGVPMPSPMLSAHSAGSHPQPRFWATSLFPVDKVLKRVLKSR